MTKRECKSAKPAGPTSIVQRAVHQGATDYMNGTPLVRDVLSSTGQPMDAEAQRFLSPRFDHDFSRVRIHADHRAVASAQCGGAKTFSPRVSARHPTIGGLRRDGVGNRWRRKRPIRTSRRSIRGKNHIERSRRGGAVRCFRAFAGSGSVTLQRAEQLGFLGSRRLAQPEFTVRSRVG